MATYTINVGQITSATALAAAGEIMQRVAAHAPGWNYTVSALALGSGATANMLRITVSTTLTAAQLQHLGLA